MSQITIGSVPYLNARPLMRWFTETPEGRASGIEVIEAVPSQLAKMLERGKVACALVSSVELFKNSELTFAPGCAVIADGAVESVRMLSKVPVGEVRKVALDTSSLTSVALLKILLIERYHLAPEYINMPPNLYQMLEIADAALLIGDRGYRDYGTSLGSFDLGAEWKTYTSLPFVYACWIGYKQAFTPQLIDALHTAKSWGETNILSIAKSEYRGLNETLQRTEHYLTEVMRYTMGEREEQALHLFGEKVRAHNLV